MKKLIGHLNEYMDGSWNAKGEMVIDGKTLPGSDITVLVIDMIRKAKHEVGPVGRKSLKLNLVAVSSEILKSWES